MTVQAGPSIGFNTKIAPTAIIGSNVSIGDNCIISDHVIIRDGVTIGNHNHIYPFAVIGEDPQDLKYSEETSCVEIGDYNRIREFVTIHRATGQGSRTIIGSHCFLMAYAHVGHNSKVGDHVILTNSVQLAGYVEVGDYAVIGGDASVHQHCRVGACAMLGGKSATNQDLPPFVIATGIPARGISINRHALRRASISPESIREIRKAFNVLYREANTLAASISKLETNPDPSVQLLVSFLKQSRRGIKLSGPTWGGNSGDAGDFDNTGLEASN